MNVVEALEAFLEADREWHKYSWHTDEQDSAFIQARLAAIKALNKNSSVWVVSFSGGYDAPSYAVFDDKLGAWAQAAVWQAAMDEDEGDTVDVLQISLSPLKIERLDAP